MDLSDARTLIARGCLPAASYRLPDGTEMFPEDYFALLDEVEDVGALRHAFARRFVARAALQGETVLSDRVEREWRGYLSGEYGVCLRRVTPENIARKEWLVARLGALLAAPHAADPAWRSEVRAGILELDGLLRPFAACDRIRFGGSVSRDRLVDAPRRAYPELFEPRGLESIEFTPSRY
jgi:hypothetical protein